MTELNPQHIAIIMDGNGRWATSMKKKRKAGHERGVSTVQTIIKLAAKYKIKYLTLFAFSCENWGRPALEVKFLMNLFTNSLNKHINDLNENNIKLHFIGNREKLESNVLNRINSTEKLTATNSGLQVNIALNYSGRWDIMNAMKKYAQNQAKLNLEALNEAEFNQYFQLSNIPEPDLLIRTGGEKRISNFLLWQIAYTELYFTDIFWPDFDALAFEEAIRYYHNRDRRFGLVKQEVDEVIL